MFQRLGLISPSNVYPLPTHRNNKRIRHSTPKRPVRLSFNSSPAPAEPCTRRTPDAAILTQISQLGNSVAVSCAKAVSSKSFERRHDSRSPALVSHYP